MTEKIRLNLTSVTGTHIGKAKVRARTGAPGGPGGPRGPSKPLGPYEDRETIKMTIISC